MSNPYFSIVIPVYQAEKYLSGMLDSIHNQTFQDYEVILVHDQGTDGSLAICRQYENKDSRFRVLDLPQNRGASGARNAGLQLAKGEYVGCMDADDTIDTDLLERVYESLQENPADYVVYGAVEEYQTEIDNAVTDSADSNAVTDSTESNAVTDSADSNAVTDSNAETTSGSGKKEASTSRTDTVRNRNIIHKKVEKRPNACRCKTAEELRPHIMELENLTLYGYPWNKFCRRSVLVEHQVRFPDWPLLEDLAFNIEFCNHIGSMNVLDITPYHYRMITGGKSGSLTSRFIKDYYKIHATCVEMLLDQQISWGLCTDEVRRQLCAIYVRYLFSALQRNCDKRGKMNHRARRRFLKDVYKSRIYQELIPYGRQDGLMLKVMLFLAKYKWTFGSLALGRIIYIVKSTMPAVFIKLKQVRN